MSADPRSYHGASFKVVSDHSDNTDLRTPSATLYRGTELVSAGLSFDLERRVLRTGNDTTTTPSSQKMGRGNPFDGVEIYSCYSRIGPKVPDNRVDQTRALAMAISSASRPALPPDAKPMPSLYVYFGQFLAHEVSKLYNVENGEPQNFVSPSLDLDTFFWKTKQPPADLQSEFAKFGMMHVGGTGVGLTSREDILEHHDLPRDQDGSPLVPDKRADSNLSLAQLQTRMTLNYLKRSHGRDEAAAQAQFIEDVQVVTLYDYLRRIINEQTYNCVMTQGRKMVRPGKGDPGEWLLPLEFAAAAYRFGHAVVRDDYVWSHVPEGDNQSLDHLMRRTQIGGGLENRSPYGNLVLESDWIMKTNDMIGAKSPNNAPALVPCIPAKFGRLEKVHVENATDKVNLAEQTLELGRKTKLAPAQVIWQMHSAALNGAPLSCADLVGDQPPEVRTSLEIGNLGERLCDQTPLWYYTLREAQKLGGGVQLGPLAGRIVIETLHAAICAYQKGAPPADNGTRLEDLL